MLARQAGLSRGQVSNWFINARVRLWKPMVEEMYKVEFGVEMDSTNSSSEKHGRKYAPRTRTATSSRACARTRTLLARASCSTHTSRSRCPAWTPVLVQPEAAPSHSWTSALARTKTGGGRHRLELGHGRISPADANGAAAGALTPNYL